MAETADKPKQLSAVERSRIAAKRAAQQATVAQQVRKPKIRKKAGFFGTVMYAAVGLAFLFLALIIRALLPAALEEPLGWFFPHFPYFFTGIGLFCLAHSRGRTRGVYEIESLGNRNHPQRWKIPLLAGQGLLLYLLGVYAFGVGLAFWPPVKHPLALVCFLIAVGLYGLWYLAAFLMRHGPRSAGVQLSMVSVVLAFASLFSWVFTKLHLVSLSLAVFALFCGLWSTAAASPKPAEGEKPLSPRAYRLRLLFLAAAALVLFPVAWWALPAGKPTVSLVEWAPVVSDLEGEVVRTAFSPDGHRLAFVQRRGEGFALGIVDSRSPKPGEIVLVDAGEKPVQPVFAAGGEWVLLDAEHQGVRNLWVANSRTGSARLMAQGPILPFGEGPQYSFERNEVFFIRPGVPSRLVGLRLDGSAETVYVTQQNLRSPAWDARNGEIVWIAEEGGKDFIGAFDPQKRRTRVVLKAQEPQMPDPYTPEGKAFLKKYLSFLLPKERKAPRFSAVIPSPDGQRYLYLSHADGSAETQFRLVFPDGTRDALIWKIRDKVEEVRWHPDGQAFFAETRQRRLGFLTPASQVVRVQANTGAVASLILPHFPHGAPSVSPDGVRAAFSAESGLWLPSFGKSGIFIALLR